MKGVMATRQKRDEVIEFVEHWSDKTGIAVSKMIPWIKITPSKYYDWKSRYGQSNRHNGSIPKSHWILDEEREAILTYCYDHLEEGYRRLCYMMIDDDVVATSPATVYRVLQAGGRLQEKKQGFSTKGKGFDQPSKPHQHWHIDVSYLNICGTFYYLCSILDGYSRAIIHHQIREQMTEADVEIVLQRALELYRGHRTRIISDNGPQFIARDFKVFIRENSLQHVRTSPYYPQSNGKKERYFRTLKSSCIRKKVPLSLEDARRIVEEFVSYYNEVRLHSAIGYITPKDMLEGRAEGIYALRVRRLRQARDVRVSVHALGREERLEEAA